MLLLTFVYILQDLGYYKHLVNLIACVSTGDPICLITEFCEKGDLLHLLRAEKDNIINVGQGLYCNYWLDAFDCGIYYYLDNVSWEMPL